MNQSEILSNLDNPRELEKLYQQNKTAFKTEFNVLYPQLTNHNLAAYWHERLNYESGEISWGSKNELFFVIIASLVAGFIAKLPVILNITLNTFYQRNIGFIVFPILTTYFFWKNGLSTRKMVLAGIAFSIALFFINLLPADTKSDTLILVLHSPAAVFVGRLRVFLCWRQINSSHKRLDFLRYNGDLVIMSTLILIAGAILTGITIGLFKLIGYKIEKFYTEYIGIIGLAAVPIVATYITQTNPQLVNRVSPVIAKIFSPLVLITLVVYLIAILISGKDPYNDRDFLMVFNALLIGVMAIILFSVAESFKKNENRISRFYPDCLIHSNGYCKRNCPFRHSIQNFRVGNYSKPAGGFRRECPYPDQPVNRNLQTL